MELPTEILQQRALNFRPKIEEHMLIVMDKSNEEEHLSQTKPTNNKQFKIAITFLTGYKGIFNVTNSDNNSISRNQLLIKMVLQKLVYHQVLTRLKL